MNSMSITYVITVQRQQYLTSNNNSNNNKRSRLKLFSLHLLFDYYQQQIGPVTKISINTLNVWNYMS